MAIFGFDVFSFRAERSKMEDFFKSIFSLEGEKVNCNGNRDIFNTVLSILLTLGIFGSYLPQHIKIISSGTSEGLSAWYLLLGSLSMGSLVMNSIILQYGFFDCCYVIPLAHCLDNLLGVIQVFVQAFAYFLVVFLFLFYFPRDKRYISRLHSRVLWWTMEFKMAVIVTLVSVFYLSIIVFLSFVLLMAYGDASESMYSALFANALGLFSMVVSIIQFMPQLIKTIRSGQIGALSIPMMALQAPGSFLFAYTLAVRPGANITTWITYLCTGLLQTGLLSICIFYSFRDRWRNQAGNGDDVVLIDGESRNSDDNRDKEDLLFVKQALDTYNEEKLGGFRSLNTAPGSARNAQAALAVNDADESLGVVDSAPGVIQDEVTISRPPARQGDGVTVLDDFR